MLVRWCIASRMHPTGYLPENTQGVICQPMGENGALILAANAPRSYTRQDEAWVEGIADKLGHTLDTLVTDDSIVELTATES